MLALPGGKHLTPDWSLLLVALFDGKGPAMDLLVGELFVVVSPNGKAALVVKVPLLATRGDLCLILQRMTGLDLLGNECESGYGAHPWTGRRLPEFTVTWEGDPTGGYSPFAGDVRLLDHGLRLGAKLEVRPVCAMCAEDATRADGAMLEAMVRSPADLLDSSGHAALPAGGPNGMRGADRHSRRPGMTEGEFRGRVELRAFERRRRDREGVSALHDLLQGRARPPHNDLASPCPR